MNISEYLESGQIVVLDGGFGTLIEKRSGELIGQKSRVWGASFLKTDPSLIKQIHLDYLQAGADIIITSSFKAHASGFAEIGVGEPEAFELCVKSTKLAQQAVHEFWADESNREGRVRPFVAASIAPYCGGFKKHSGKMYNGNYEESAEEYKNYHRWLLQAVTKEKPDLVAFEAMPRLDEVQALCSLLEEEFPSQLAYFCFTCADGDKNASGTCIEQCASFLNTQKQVVAFGANCIAPEHAESLLKKMRTVTSKPLIVYPNSGETYDSPTGTWLKGSISDELVLQQLLPKWRNAGATVIGGCCRTTEEYVRTIRKFADASNFTKP